MKFVAVSCGRPIAIQRMIHAYLNAWKYLEERDRQKIQGLVGQIAKSPMEGRALYDLLILKKAPDIVAAKTGVERRRLYAMRREFYEQFKV